MVSAILTAALSSMVTAPGQALPTLQPPVVAAKPDVVLVWNETALNAIRAENTAPPMAARNLAIVHAAMFDAVNAIYRTHHAYYVSVEPPPLGTSPQAAAAVAAHRTLVTLYPKRVNHFDLTLDDCLAAIPEGRGKRDGITLGQYVGEKLLAWRAKDGATTQVRYNAGGGPGVWEPTPPGFKPALLPQWPSCTCFALPNGARFRPAGPPALTSGAYTASYLEVKALGGARSKERTSDQTEIAYFWADGDGTATPPGHWNQIAQNAARTKGTSFSENARLFALLNIALADAGIACWECKYKFNFWRPIQGIRQADLVDNPDTPPDRDWSPLLVTPPFPTYTSGHSTFSGAGAAVLANFFGSDELRLSIQSDGLPRVTRSFDRFSAAAAEAGKSRIYGGIHWEFDNADGLASGKGIGDYVSRYFLRPRGESGVEESRSSMMQR
ncbi:MAG: vanadium-dependent haloperoxidase [Gemmataceae bacterium]|nr:vanadium-dependent haloperoxidase [Gemmataceae bacterium]